MVTVTETEAGVPRQIAANATSFVKIRRNSGHSADADFSPLRDVNCSFRGTVVMQNADASSLHRRSQQAVDSQ